MKQLEQIRHFIETQPVNLRVMPMKLSDINVWVKRKQPLENWKDYYKVLVTPGLKREIKALLLLSKQQLPVPKVIVHCDDFFVSEDSGQALNKLLKGDKLASDKRQLLLYKAGHALAQMHKQGYAHGRPALRDICWDGNKITFIDFELHSGKPSRSWDQYKDILVFLHGLYNALSEGDTEADAALQGYLDNDGQERFQTLQARARHFSWLLPLLDKLQGIAGRDLRQVSPALRLILQESL